MAFEGVTEGRCEEDTLTRSPHIRLGYDPPRRCPMQRHVRTGEVVDRCRARRPRPRDEAAHEGQKCVADIQRRPEELTESRAEPTQRGVEAPRPEQHEG